MERPIYNAIIADRQRQNLDNPSLAFINLVLVDDINPYTTTVLSKLQDRQPLKVDFEKPGDSRTTHYYRNGELVSDVAKRYYNEVRANHPRHLAPSRPLLAALVAEYMVADSAVYYSRALSTNSLPQAAFVDLGRAARDVLYTINDAERTLSVGPETAVEEAMARLNLSSDISPELIASAIRNYQWLAESLVRDKTGFSAIERRVLHQAATSLKPLPSVAPLLDNSIFQFSMAGGLFARDAYRLIYSQLEEVS